MRSRILVAALFACAPALALAALPGPAAGPSEAVFPPQTMPLKFSHKQHLGFKLACDFCHDAAPDSTKSSDRLIPSEDACSTCHKIDRADPNRVAKPAARCDACHVYPPGSDVKAPPLAEVPAPNLKFNHKVHIDREIPCTRCHEGMDKIDLAGRAQLPRMAICLGCHNRTVKEGRAPSKCATCHLTTFDGTLETTFPSGRLIPSGSIKGDLHGPNFDKDHARVAQPDEGYCLSCHRREQCLSCHAGVVKPMRVHQNDYVSIHAIDARKNTTDCNACHRRQSFCLGCHERSRVVDDATTPGDARSLTSTGRRFHPPAAEWVGDVTGATRAGPNHHSWQAIRNVRACMSCHREDTCLQCHQAMSKPGGVGNIDPHPAGFAGSRQCEAMRSKNGRVCLKCHAPTDAHLSCMP